LEKAEVLLQVAVQWGDARQQVIEGVTRSGGFDDHPAVFHADFDGLIQC
jgi:hypothetical protein